jgi:hypothetical protein
MALLERLWKILDGNKTIICSIVFGFIAKFGVQIGISELTVEMVLWVSGFLGAGSLAHHIQKGKLNTHNN